MTNKKTKKRRKQNIISSYTAARLLHMTKQTFINHLEDGIFPFPAMKLGNEYKFRREDIEMYIEKSFKVIKK